MNEPPPTPMSPAPERVEPQGGRLDLSPLPVPLWPMFVYTFAIAWMSGTAWWHRRVTVDDPWITFRYARNLITGEGLVFNPGEYVEGFSNLSWVLLSAVGMFLRVEPLSFARTLSWLLAAGMMAWLVSRPRERLAVVLLAAMYPFGVWVMGGLETILHAALVLALVGGLAAVARGGWGAVAVAGGAVAGLILTRPEGFIWLALPAMLVWLTRREPGDTPARALAVLALGAMVLGILITWRMTTYGALLPNTVAAKVGGGPLSTALRGTGYLLYYVAGVAGVLAMLAAWGWLRGRRADPRESEPRRLRFFAAAAIALQCSFTFAVGGDWMPAARFLVPVLAPACLLAAWALGRWPFFIRVVVLGFFLVAGVVEARENAMLRWCRWAAQHQGGGLLVQPLVETGEWLKINARDGDVFAASEAGAMPYLSGLRFIDMLGLVDPHIAQLPGGLHQKYDAEYVLDRHPHFIVLGLTVRGEDDEVGTWAPDQQMLASDRFAADYELVHRVPRAMPDAYYGRIEQGWMAIYQRRAGTMTRYWRRSLAP